MSPSRYPTSLRVLHWFIATLIIAALVMGTFVMAQAMIVAPTVGELRADMAERRAERRAAAAKENRSDPATEPDGGIPATDVGFFG